MLLIIKLSTENDINLANKLQNIKNYVLPIPSNISLLPKWNASWFLKQFVHFIFHFSSI